MGTRARIILVSLLTMLALTGAARGDHRDDVERARRRLDEAERRLEHARHDVRAINRRLEDADDQYESAVRALEALQAVEARLVHEYGSASQRRPVVIQELSGAQSAIESHRARIPVLEQAVRAAADHVEQTERALSDAFLSGPAFSAIAARVQDAERAHADAAARVRDALFDRDDFLGLLSAAYAAEDELEAWRRARPNDHATIERLSRRWIEAMNEVERYESQALTGDPSTAVAWRELLAARREAHALRTQFESDLRRDPAVLIAVRDHDARRQELAATAEGLHQAESAAAQLAGEAQQLDAILTGHAQLIDRARHDISIHAQAVDHYADEANVLRRSLIAARHDLHRAQREHDDAARRLRELIEQGVQRDRDREREREHERERDDGDREDRPRTGRIDRDRHDRGSEGSGSDEEEATRRRREEEQKAAARRAEDEKRRDEARSDDAEDAEDASDDKDDARRESSTDRGDRYERRR